MMATKRFRPVTTLAYASGRWTSGYAFKTSHLTDRCAVKVSAALCGAKMDDMLSALVETVWSRSLHVEDALGE